MYFVYFIFLKEEMVFLIADVSYNVEGYVVFRDVNDT